jgi:predicted dehydrogenase
MKATNGLTRREAIRSCGALAAASVLTGVALPAVHGSSDETIQVALIGCGGRGTGAAENALRAKNAGPVKLVAMADVFQDRLAGSYDSLVNEFKDQMDVPAERKFISFDGYKQAMDCLRPGDVVILTTPPAFRWVHFKHAIDKGLNVFMEKPVTVDGPSSRRMLKLGEDSVAKNLKVGVGLMCRHCPMRQELFERIKSGEIGDITFMRAYRMAGPTASAFSVRNPGEYSDLLYQIRRFHSFLWASGGAFSDFLIHNIDECCWMKDAWPVEAKASGGRHYRGDFIDQNFDTYSVEYTFADGAKLFLEGRCIEGCKKEFASYAHGTKGSAIISAAGHTPCRCRTFKNQVMKSENIIWRCPNHEPNPYQVEWDDLLAAIRKDQPFNEVKRGVEASLAACMGRLAAHTGQVVTWDQMLGHEHELAPNVDKLAMDSPPPVLPDSSGRYPVPEPGIKRRREY